MTLDPLQDRHRPHGFGQRVQDFVKQIVYGGNDGIVTTFAIVAGFAGAQAEGVAQIGGLAVLVFGLANLFADAVSMGLGEFLSGRAQNDLYRSRRTAELRAIACDPAAEQAALAQLMAQRGLPQDEAGQMAGIVVRHPEVMADMMMRYEHGLQDPSDGSPAIDGLVTFCSFVLFGCVPIAPYFLMEASDRTFVLSVLATFGALMALGLLRWRATHEGLVRSTGETVLVGAVCAGVAYLVGWLVGG